jgi:hypothetical protein
VAEAAVIPTTTPMTASAVIPLPHAKFPFDAVLEALAAPLPDVWANVGFANKRLAIVNSNVNFFISILLKDCTFNERGLSNETLSLIFFKNKRSVLWVKIND